ncbi:MAG TPA: hypothetical protein VK009_27340 [Chloroflexota bacterium]|nr:hypothetical protein [Chloroflexota bacterium]
MEFRADLRCMVCSHFLGEVSGTKHGPTRVAIRTFVPGAHYHGPVRPSPKRCDKCGGHLYLDEVELMFGHTPATESAPAAAAA